MIQFIKFICDTVMSSLKLFLVLLVTGLCINAVQCSLKYTLICLFCLAVLLAFCGVTWQSNYQKQQMKAAYEVNYRTFGSHLRKKGAIAFYILTIVLFAVIVYMYLFNKRVYFNDFSVLFTHVNKLHELAPDQIPELSGSEMIFTICGALPSKVFHNWYMVIDSAYEAVAFVQNPELSEHYLKVLELYDLKSVANYKAALILLFIAYGICMAIIQQFLAYHKARKLLKDEVV